MTDTDFFADLAQIDSDYDARPRDPTPAEQEIEKAKCAADPVYFINKYCKIYDSVAQQWIPFSLWDAQIDALRTVMANKYTVVLKARQEGLSWLLGDVYPLWQMIFKPIAKILMFSQRDDEAIGLIERLKGTYIRLPDWLKPDVSIDNDHEFQLVNGSNAQALPSSAGGRSNAATYVFIDEADFVDNLKSLITAAKPTIDAGQNKMVVCSTRDKDKTNTYFHSLYKTAKGSGQWAAIFLPWYVRPDRTGCRFTIEQFLSATQLKYKVVLGDERKLTTPVGDETVTELRLMNITRNNIRVVQNSDGGFVTTLPAADNWQVGDTVIALDWYDKEAADKMRTDGSLDNMYGEYPATDVEALADRELNKRFPPQWIAQVTQQRTPLPIPINAPAKPGLRIYRYPEPGRSYGIGADPAGGLTDSDPSVAQVIDAVTKEQVAVLSGKIEPSTFGDDIADLSEYYNGAPVNFELNNHGHEVRARLKARGVSLRNGVTKNGPSRNPGWFTTQWAKQYLYDKAVDVVRQAIEEARLSETPVEPIIFDFVTSVELASIERTDELKAPPGQHDDHAMSWALAQMCVYRGSSSMTQSAYTGLYGERPVGKVAPQVQDKLQALQRARTVAMKQQELERDVEELNSLSNEQWLAQLRRKSRFKR